jgi:hypothetical protein
MKGTSRATAIQYSSPASWAVTSLSKRGAGGCVGSCASGPATSNASPDCGLVSLTAVDEARMISSKSAGSSLCRARNRVP